MKTFEEIIKILKENSVSLKGWVEVSAMDEKISKAIFPNAKISFVRTPTFFISESGDVVDGSNSEENFKSLTLSTMTIPNQAGMTGLDRTSGIVYIHSIKLYEHSSENIIEVRFCTYNPSSKKKVTFTISENVVNDFSKISDRLAINKSKFVENKIKEFIEKNN